MDSGRPRRLALRRAALAALAALVALTPVAAARADWDETERRLKAVGVDDALRDQIHHAIDRGVQFLTKRQEADGSFVEHGSGPASKGYEYERVGVTLLATLALRHAGTPPTGPAVEKAVEWLFLHEPHRRLLMETRVYEAGLALMLLAAVPGHEPVARRIASGLAAGLDAGTAWWGYDTPGGSLDPAYASKSAPWKANLPNLSTAQFAALGLWAARRMGIDVPASVWSRHAAALVDTETRLDSWNYYRGPIPAAVPGSPATPGDGYPTGTYMGLANLLLAARALETARDVPAGLRANVAKAIARARKALARDAPRTLSDPRADIGVQEDRGRAVSGVALASPLPRLGNVGPGIGAYYTLFALEKACLFADVEALDVHDWVDAAAASKPGGKPRSGKLPWYATGAKWLLAVQRPDGGWSPQAGDPPGDAASEIDTSLALLFLLRSAAVFHPTTPTEVDSRPRGPVTKDEPTPPPPQDPPPMGR